MQKLENIKEKFETLCYENCVKEEKSYFFQKKK